MHPEEDITASDLTILNYEEDQPPTNQKRFTTTVEIIFIAGTPWT